MSRTNPIRKTSSGAESGKSVIPSGIVMSTHSGNPVKPIGNGPSLANVVNRKSGFDARACCEKIQIQTPLSIRIHVPLCRTASLTPWLRFS